MNYQEALNYISNIERGGSDYGVERMRLLLDLLGAPDKSFKIVHVAGTNGKGSVCAYLSSIFKAAGYRTGTYNSPSVFCYNERWRVDGEQLDDDAVAKYMTEVRECVEAENERRAKNPAKCSGALYDGALAPTAFEIETAIAALAFKDLGCDVAVLETGLGGRWDATNAVCDKELAVITPIGLDHCDILGNTLGQIAEEKAAIIRDDCVTCAQCDEVMDSLRHPYTVVDGKRINIDARVNVCKTPLLLSCDKSGQTFEYDGKVYDIPLLGEHQLQNAAIAICAVETLRNKGWKIDESALSKGLKSARWEARFEIVNDAKSRFNISIPKDKTLIFDGAHNPHGATALANAIKSYFPDAKIHMVLGILKDKDVDGVVSILAPLASRVTAITPNSPRALDKSVLREKVQKYAECIEGDGVLSALQNALNGCCDVVMLCGSLTLFKDLKKNTGGSYGG